MERSTVTRRLREHQKNQPFSIVEPDGTIEDSKIWGPTIPMDMRRWLPEKMLMLIQGSLVSDKVANIMVREY